MLHWLASPLPGNMLFTFVHGTSHKYNCTSEINFHVKEQRKIQVYGTEKGTLSNQ